MTKKFVIYTLLTLTIIGNLTCTQKTVADGLEIIPKSNKTDAQLGEKTDCVGGIGNGCEKGSVWDRYNKELKSGTEKDLGTQFATGIFSWNSILIYAAYIIRFLSQVGLLVGAVMIVVAGYKYATAVFGGKDPGTGNIKNAIIGVLIVISSYAIIRILQAASGIG